MDNFEEQSFSWNRFFFGKISRKIIISFIILGFCMAIIVTYIFYTTSITSLSSEIENHLQDTVQSRTNHIETYIFDL